MSKTNEHNMSQTKTANKQTNGVLSPADLNVSQMTITPPKKRNDKLVSYLLQDNEPVYSETPWLHAVFGVTGFEPKDAKNGTKQWSLNVSARALDGEDEDVVSKYFDGWKGADDLMVNHAVEYNDVLGMGKPKKGQKVSTDVVEALYTPVVKSDSEGKYPPRLQPKIMKKRADDGTELDDKPDVKVYVVDEGVVSEQVVNSFTELCELVPKNSVVKLIVQPRVWYIAGKFGLSLQVLQLLVRLKKSHRPSEFAFRGVGELQSGSKVETKVETEKPVEVSTSDDGDKVYNSDEEVVEDVEEVEGGEDEVVEE